MRVFVYFHGLRGVVLIAGLEHWRTANRLPLQDNQDVSGKSFGKLCWCLMGSVACCRGVLLLDRRISLVRMKYVIFRNVAVSYSTGGGVPVSIRSFLHHTSTNALPLLRE